MDIATVIIPKTILGLFAIYVLYKFIVSIQIIPTRTAVIVERFGKYYKTLNPGFHLLIPFIDKAAYTHDMREKAIGVDPQECFTNDNVKVEVDGIIYISITDPVKASYGITDYQYAAIQLAQTTTRSVIGTIDLDKTFEERDLISARVVGVLGEVEEAWGIQVHRYEVKNIIPPVTVKKAMEKQMTAERERRAMLATAEGVRQSNINDSEGIMTEIINLSEGEMQRRTNEAKGRAQEILSLAKATAESIEKVAEALNQENGKEAINMRLSQQYLSEISKLSSSEHEVLLPIDLTKIDEVLKGIHISKT